MTRAKPRGDLSSTSPMLVHKGDCLLIDVEDVVSNQLANDLPPQANRVAPILFIGDASNVSSDLSSEVGIVRTSGDFEAYLHPT